MRPHFGRGPQFKKCRFKLIAYKFVTFNIKYLVCVEFINYLLINVKTQPDKENKKM